MEIPLRRAKFGQLLSPYLFSQRRLFAVSRNHRTVWPMEASDFLSLATALSMYRLRSARESCGHNSTHRWVNQ